MAESNKDDLARALEQLSSGEHAEHAEPAEDGMPSASAPLIGTNAGAPDRPGKARPAAPAAMPGAPRPVAPRPVVPPGATPLPPRAVPAPPKLGQAKKPVAAKPKAEPTKRPAAPQRPAAPTAPTAEIASPIATAPSSEVRSAPELQPSGASEQPAAEQAFVVDDGDDVIVPAQPMESLGHLRPAAATAPTSRIPRVPVVRSLEARRTLIPILLTLGIMLNVAAGVRLAVSENTPLGMVPRGLAWGAIAAGAILLIVAVLNMIQVRAELRQARVVAASS